MRSAILECHPRGETVRTATPNFNRLAHIYRWMEWLTFGPFLGRCRCAFLNVVNHHRSALVIGDGDGRYTARLLHENPHIIVDAVDASEAMLDELTRRTAPNGARLHALVADARTYRPPHGDYDLIATHFFLDCLTSEEVKRLAVRLRNHVRTDATWVISEFAVPSGWYGRTIAQPLITALYCAFDWLTGLQVRRLPNHRIALAQAGWSLEREEKHLHGLLVSELWRANTQKWDSLSPDPTRSQEADMEPSCHISEAS